MSVRMHLLTAIVALLVLLAMTASSVRTPRKNVLLIISDDLRPELGSYSGVYNPRNVGPAIITPNLDALAARSLLLRRAYVQQAICGASRSSFLTARRPDSTHVYGVTSYWREVGGNFTTLPQYFRERGYNTVGIGKIFHGGSASGSNDPLSWDEIISSPPEPNIKAHSWKQVSPAEEAANPLRDQVVSKRTIETLQEVAPDALSGKQPFFVATGYFRPHLPLLCPRRFFKLYPGNAISLPDNPYAPVNMPELAWSSYNELRGYKDIAHLGATGDINTTLPNSVTKNLRRAYYACASFIDEQVGLVLQELERLGLKDNTIVAFLGDHGYQLGEHGLWAKQTNFEIATHTPMMVSIPGVTDGGNANDELVEFVDLFPTLVEAAGLPKLRLCPRDSSSVLACREGTSLMPLLGGASASRGDWKDRVFSQYIRGTTKMGYSMRTKRYRYTEWVGFTGEPTYQPQWDVSYGVELYDLRKDPQENWNIAVYPTKKVLVDELSAQLRSGWRSAIPN